MRASPTDAPSAGAALVPEPVPEPQPAPSDPPGPVIVPEPEPVPHEPPGPVIVPEPHPPETAVYAVPGAGREPAELLDVDVDELARPERS